VKLFGNIIFLSKWLDYVFTFVWFMGINNTNVYNVGKCVVSARYCFENKLIHNLPIYRTRFLFSNMYIFY